MEQRFPALVFRGSPETPRVILERAPADEQEITIRGFQAAVQLVREITRRGGDDRLRLAERALELRRSARHHLEHGGLEDHRVSLPRVRKSVKSSPVTRAGVRPR